MVRDNVLTMANRYAMSVEVDANTLNTNATEPSPDNVPDPANLDARMPETSGEPGEAGLKWYLMVEEVTGTPVQVEGAFHAELQFSLDQGSTWQTGDGLEIQLDDPCLAASGRVERERRIGVDFAKGLGVTDPTQVRWQTVFSISGRTGGDAVAAIVATSLLGL